MKKSIMALWMRLVEALAAAWSDGTRWSDGTAWTDTGSDLLNVIDGTDNVIDGTDNVVDV